MWLIVVILRDCVSIFRRTFFLRRNFAGKDRNLLRVSKERRIFYAGQKLYIRSYAIEFLLCTIKRWISQFHMYMYNTGRYLIYGSHCLLGRR